MVPSYFFPISSANRSRNAQASKMAASGSKPGQHSQYESQQGFSQPQQFPQQAKPQIPLLAPLPPPGIFCLPQCIAQGPTSLILRERMFSLAGSSEIFSVDGSLMFIVKGAVMSLSKRKEVYDSQGQHLFTVRAEVFQFPASYYCESPKGQRFMDVRGRWSCMCPLSLIVAC